MDGTAVPASKDFFGQLELASLKPLHLSLGRLPEIWLVARSEEIGVGRPHRKSVAEVHRMSLSLLLLFKRPTGISLHLNSGRASSTHSHTLLS